MPPFCENTVIWMKGAILSTERTLTLDSVVQRSSDLLFTEVDGDLVMLSMRKNKYYGTQVTGNRIWMLIEEPTTIRAVVDDLMQEYAVERDICERETLAFLQQLVNEELVDVRG